jgi:hypothetical protein
MEENLRRGRRKG